MRTPEPATDRRMISPALVGRGQELAQLVATVSAPPAVAVVEGEAGIGKTRLVTELRRQLGTAGDRVAGAGDRRFAAGWCCQIREPFPLGPVIEAARGLRGELAGASLSPVVGALRPLLPEVAEVLPPQPPPLGDRIAERHQVFRGLVEVLGGRGPVVLVIEDMHWADAQTLDFVSYLLADLPANLSLVVTFRGEEVAASVRALTAKLAAPVTRLHQELRLLDEAETGALAAAILGTDRVSREFAGYLHERTAGLPFAIEELLALLRVRADLARRGGRWSRQALQRLDVPTGIRDSVLARVGGLSTEARRVVEAAAVLQARVPVPVLTNTSQVPADQAIRAVEEVLEAGLFTEDGTDGEQVGFRHPLAAQAVYGAMPATRRRRLHGRAAAELAGRQPPRLGQLAHHLRHAGQLDAWVAAAERAADQAAALAHYDEAVQLLEDVLRHAPLGVEQRGRVAVRLARTAIETLHARDVRNLLLAVPAADLPRPVRSELRLWLGLLLQQTGGEPRRQRQLLVDATEELTDRPDLRAWAMLALGIPNRGAEVSLAEHLRWLHRSMELVPELTDPAQQVLILGKAAMVLAAVGDPQWRELTDRMRRQTGGAPRDRREVNAYESVGADACVAGHHEAAHELLAAARAGAGGCHSRRLELRSQASMALLDYCRGSWDGLRERAELLVDELGNYPEGRIGAAVVVSCLPLVEGELELAEQRLTELVPEAERMGCYDLLPLPVTALLRLAIAQGTVEPTLGRAQRVLAGIETAGALVPAVRLLPPLAQAMVAAGRTGEARALVDRLAGALRGLDAPLAPAAVAHARGSVAAGTRRWREAAQQFLAAADQYEALACPYEAAQAREQAAQSLVATGDDDAAGAAAQALNAALATYRRLPARWDASRVTNLARRRGLSLPAAHRGGRRGYGGRLSPREQEVAHRAAAGRTNEEIARELFLSPKTVEKHVSSALRKLGLTSRRALQGQPGM